MVAIERGKSRSEGLCKQLNTHTHTHADSRITNDTKISLGGVCVRVCIVKRGLGEMIRSRRCVKKNGMASDGFPSPCEKKCRESEKVAL